MKCQRCGAEFNGNYCPVCGEWIKKEAGIIKPESQEQSIHLPQSPAKLRRPLYTRVWFILAALLLFFPAGLYLMWKYEKFTRPVRVLNSKFQSPPTAHYLIHMKGNSGRIEALCHVSAAILFSVSVLP